jgi:hypothetical protein
MTRPLPRITDEEMARGQPADVEAGFGALATARGCLPLAALDVRARIEGLLARVEVRQTFVNAHGEPRPTGLQSPESAPPSGFRPRRTPCSGRSSGPSA